MMIRAAYLIRRPVMWQVERTCCDQPSTHFPNSLRNNGQQTCFCLCVVECMFEGQCITIGRTVFKLQCFYFCNKLHLGCNKRNSRTAKRIQHISWYSKGIPVLRATKDPPDTASSFSLTVKRYRLLSGIRISNRQEIFQEFRDQQANHIFLCVTHVTRPCFASVSFWFSTQWFALSAHRWWQKQKGATIAAEILDPVANQWVTKHILRRCTGWVGGWVAARWQRCLLMRIKSGEEERGGSGGVTGNEGICL